MTLKKTQVVMLPTNEKAKVGDIVTRPSDNRMAIVNVLTKDDPQPCIYQHLYFLSDEEIKEGDWWFNVENKEIGKSIYKNGIPIEWGETNKIIATTDREIQALKFRDSKLEAFSNVLTGIKAQPSQSFLEVFVREYNKGNVIKEVMVEYEDKGHEDWIGDNENGEPFWIEDWKLKVNPKDNTITIKRVKDDFTYNQVLTFGAWYSGMSEDKVKKQLDKWIEQNL